MSRSRALIKRQVEMREAILIVDAQYDFFPGGALAVPQGDEIIEPIQKLINHKRLQYAHQYPVFITQDWHPEDTRHFIAKGGIWPPHCVQDTRGAEIHEDIDQALLAFRIDSSKIWVKAYRKGTNPDDDGGYSAFDGVGEGRLVNGVWDRNAGRPLLEDLRQEGVDTLIVCGLATDYCVKASVLDALKNGFDVKLYLDGIRAVNINDGDGDKAIQEMLDAGAVPVTLDEVKEMHSGD